MLAFQPGFRKIQKLCVFHELHEESFRTKQIIKGSSFVLLDQISRQFRDFLSQSLFRLGDGVCDETVRTGGRLRLTPWSKLQKKIHRLPILSLNNMILKNLLRFSPHHQRFFEVKCLVFGFRMWFGLLGTTHRLLYDVSSVSLLPFSRHWQFTTTPNTSLNGLKTM